MDDKNTWHRAVSLADPAFNKPARNISIVEKYFLMGVYTHIPSFLIKTIFNNSEMEGFIEL